MIGMVNARYGFTTEFKEAKNRSEQVLFETLLHLRVLCDFCGEIPICVHPRLSAANSLTASILAGGCGESLRINSQ